MQSSNFRIPLYIALTVLVVVLSLFVRNMFIPSASDRAAYHTLLNETQPANSTAPVTPYTAQQQRRGGQKDLYFTQRNERLQLRLTNADALMVLDHTTAGTQLVEKMQEVKCWMQEELFYLLADGKEAFKQPNGKLLLRGEDPQNESAWRALAEGTPMQHLRYLEAEKATYSYKSDHVEATNVKLARYKLPGHIFKTDLQGLKPHFQGKAVTAEFSMAGGEPHFKAHQLKASLIKGSM